MDWFLDDRNLRHERVKYASARIPGYQKFILFTRQTFEGTFNVLQYSWEGGVEPTEAAYQVNVCRLRVFGL